MSTIRICTLGLLITGCFLLAPFTTIAATLGAVPDASHVTAGNIVTVRLLVNGADQAINAANGVLSFPADFLKVLSIDTSHSIFPLWIQPPSFSNTNGTITFDGGVPSPGFTGTAGAILAITFQAEKPGTATLSLSGASVLANDGLGTDVLTGTDNATLTIQNPPPAESGTKSKTSAESTNSAPPKSSTVSASSASATTSATVIPTPPAIESYTRALMEGQQFVLSGTVATGTSEVLIFEQKDASEIDQYTLAPDIQGYFTFVSPSWSAGDYQIWAVSLSAATTSRSADSTHIALHITPPVFAQIGPLNITLSFIIITLLVLLLVQFGVALFSAYRLRVFRKDLESGIMKSEKDIQKGFSLLKEDVEKHSKKKDLEEDIEDLEKFTQEDIKNLGKT